LSCFLEILFLLLFSDQGCGCIVDIETIIVVIVFIVVLVFISSWQGVLRLFLVERLLLSAALSIIVN